MSGSTSTRILTGKPPRAMWSAAMLLGLYRIKAASLPGTNCWLRETAYNVSTLPATLEFHRAQGLSRFEESVLRRKPPGSCRSCAVGDAANPSDDSDTADRRGACEAYRPGSPKASVSIERPLG